MRIRPLSSTLILWISFASLILTVLLFPQLSTNINNKIYALETGNIRPTIPAALTTCIRSDYSVWKDFTVGADFAGFYFRAKYYTQGDIYENFSYDALHRPLAYPPLFCYLYYKIFCPLSYPKAAALHLIIQVVLLMLATFYVLYYYRIRFMFIPLALIYLLLIFMTPLGLYWIECGQCDIYPALAILFLLMGIYESRWQEFLLAAIFASLKITIYPLIAQIFIIYLIVDYRHQKLSFFLLFSVVITLSLCLFPYYTRHFLLSLYSFRDYIEPLYSMTIVNRIPMMITHLIPVASLLIYLIPLLITPHRKQILLKTLIPYVTSMAAINTLLVNTAWEYRTVHLLGFIPMVIVWGFWCWDSVYKKEFLLMFFTFIFIVFHGFWFISESRPALEYIICSYMAYTVAVAIITITRISN